MKKKFDICLMNPPYASGYLELKFLEKVIDISEKVVSVQPLAWLEKPDSYNNEKSPIFKYSKIIDYINDIDILDNAHELFGIHGNVDIGIYSCDNNGGYDFENIKWKNINKSEYNTFDNTNLYFPKLEEYDEVKNNTKAFVNIKTFANNARTTRYNIVAPNTYRVIYKGILPNGEKWNVKRYKSNSLAKEKPVGIYFDTYEEAVNFYNSCLTECFKYIVSIYKFNAGVPLKKLPFMNDYIKPWTNERFFKYFNIPKEKQQEIMVEMEPYMNDNDTIKI